MYFIHVHQLESAIADYFEHIKGQLIPVYYHPPGEQFHSEVNKQLVYSREPEPPTLTGMILHIGIKSRAAFDAAAGAGKFSETLQRARLRIEAAYEKKLHQPSPTGAHLCP